MFSFGRPRRWHPLQKLGLALLVAGSVLGGLATARDVAPPVAAAAVALAELPAEARQTEELIRSGGPFPHAQDGVVFGNRERLLPGQSRGYYREYTVRTPGLTHRGARRIVCGGRQPKQPEVCYYTEDHYASFRRIVQ